MVAFYKTRDDWMDNPSGNAMGFDDLGEMEQKVLRGAATWIISDTSTADFRFEFGEDDSDPRPIWAEKNDALLGAQPIPGISEAPVRKGSDPLANGVTTHLLPPTGATPVLNLISVLVLATSSP